MVLCFETNGNFSKSTIKDLIFYFYFLLSRLFTCCPWIPLPFVFYSGPAKHSPLSLSPSLFFSCFGSVLNPYFPRLLLSLPSSDPVPQRGAREVWWSTPKSPPLTPGPSSFLVVKTSHEGRFHL